MSKEQQYYEMLTRTDNPVFKRDFALVQDNESPFNSILNRVLARALCRIRDDITKVDKNAFANTVTEFGIDKWEETHFGFTKPTIIIGTRVDQLVDKVNNVLTMSVSDVIAAAEQIVGATPTVIRNLFFGGWVMDEAALDLETIFSGTDQAIDGQTYVVIFTDPQDSVALARLDEELTKIEKGGSKHFIIAPPRFWIIDESAIDVDTVMG